MPPKAMIEAFDQPEHERVLSPGRVRLFYLFFTPLVVSFAFCGLGGWLAYDAGTLTLFAGLAFGGAVGLFLAYLVFDMFYLSVYPARCYLRWLRERIDGRPDAIVDADDPAAFFVQHIPRKNWGVSVGENATDLGLLLLDYDRRVLKFEGDDERWAVPADAIVSFKLDSFVPPNGNAAINRFTVVMLRVDLGGGDIVLTPLAAQPVHWRRWTPRAKEDAGRALRKAIGHLVDPGEWKRPTARELVPLIPPPR